MIQGVATRGRLRNAIALWLLLLAASPLTNPFSTLDLVPIGSSAPVVDSAKTKTSSQDDAIAGQVFAVTTLADDSGSALLTLSGGVPCVPDARHTVLRL